MTQPIYILTSVGRSRLMARLFLTQIMLALTLIVATGSVAKPKKSQCLQEPTVTTETHSDTCDGLTRKAVARVETLRASQKAATASHMNAPTSLMRMFDRMSNPKSEPETLADQQVRKVRQSVNEANEALKVSRCPVVDIDKQLSEGPPTDWSRSTKVLEPPSSNDGLNDILKDYSKNN